jgi:hypothetical protein
VIFRRAHYPGPLQGLAFIQPEERGVGLSDRAHIEFVKGVVDDVQQIERGAAGLVILTASLSASREELEKSTGQRILLKSSCGIAVLLSCALEFRSAQHR